MRGQIVDTQDDSATPRYQHRRLKVLLIEELGQGKWKRGQKIASESQLAARYGVSVGTVRRAVGELVVENILVREQGRGTFVVSHTRDYMLNAFFRIVDRDGLKELPEVRTLSVRRIKADAEMSRLLHVRPRSSVVEVETLLSLQGRPTILDHMRLPGARFQGLNADVFSGHDGTVYGLFQQRFDVTVVRIEEYITAAIATPRQCRLLDLPKNAPVMRIRRTAFTYKDEPVDLRDRLVNTTNHGYLSILGAAA